MPPVSSEELFQRHHATIFRYLLRMTAQREDAEDLTQEVFLRACGALDRYAPQGRERPWLFTIAHNLLIDRQRRTHRQVPVVRDIQPDDLPSPSSNIEAVALRQALARLPDIDREALVLREVNGLTYAEIADITGATLDAVGARLYRARTGLREILSTLDPIAKDHDHD